MDKSATVRTEGMNIISEENPWPPGTIDCGNCYDLMSI
jgi:hypothetical protein